MKYWAIGFLLVGCLPATPSGLAESLESLLRARLIDADAALARREILLAESEYREVMAASHLQLAAAYLGLQEYAAAEDSYRRAGRAVGSADEAAFVEALSNFRAGDLEPARAKLAELTTAAPGNRPARLLLAKVEFLLGHREAARSQLRQGYGEDPAELNALFLQALLDIQDGNPRGELLLAKIRAPLGDSAPLRTLFARAYRECGNTARARVEIETALRLDANYAPARQELDRIVASGEGEAGREANSILRSSRIWPEEAGQPLLLLLTRYRPLASMAEDGLARAQASMPEPPSPGTLVPGPRGAVEKLVHQSETAWARGDLGSALTAAEEAADVAPNAEPVLRLLARASLAKNDLATAIATYRRLLLMNPDLPEYWGGLGSALARNLELPEALVRFQRLIRLEPDKDEGYMLTGYVQYLLGQWDDASVNLKRALELNPDRLEALHFLAALSYDRGEFERALRLARLVLEKDPKRGETMLIVGKALRQRGDLPGALRQLQATALVTPESSEVHFELSRVFQLLGRTAEAKEELARYQSLREAQQGGAGKGTAGAKRRKEEVTHARPVARVAATRRGRHSGFAGSRVCGFAGSENVLLADRTEPRPSGWGGRWRFGWRRHIRRALAVPARLSRRVEVFAGCDRPPPLESWGSVLARPGRALHRRHQFLIHRVAAPGGMKDKPVQACVTPSPAYRM